MGENVETALHAFERARGLPLSDNLDPAVWTALTQADKDPVAKTYVISPADVAGPFTPDVGENFVAMAKQKQLNYADPKELLAARFHMGVDLLQELNPGVDFSKAGSSIIVVDPGAPPLPRVEKIVVNKALKSVTALGPGGVVLAVFPATVGSRERPSPKGLWKVKGVAQNPKYVYDPSKLHWGPRSHGKLHIPPGPKGPVGVVWIALTAPDYGIHGTPDPRLVGKAASHGCVRLTNWDAEMLSKAVRPGVPVDFLS
jgi:lipoprotein-anchoring transpeptidase ErfK/SrfK